jgi:alkylation response protein AidB-like acyl-CoA dehydrogenase
VIDLMPDADQEALVDAVAAVLKGEVPRERLREIAAGEDGFDRAFLARCGALGWFAVGLEEAAGGTGLSLAEEALLFRELGRNLVPGPFLATVLAAKVAAGAGNTALAQQIAAGGILAGLAERTMGQTVLLDCGPTELLTVVDLEAATVAVHERAGVAVTGVTESIDPFHRLGRIDGPLPAPVADAGAAADELLCHATTLAAAFLCGIAEQTRDDSVAHASTRVQYGTRIGAFQAVKHRCADMAVRAEAAWAQTALAALRVRAAGAAAGFDASAAKVVAIDAAVRNARDNIQNHGGMGYTAEHDAHLFLKRAHIVERALGDTRWHLGRALAAERGASAG